VLMLAFPPRWREMVGSMLIIFIALSACVALGEFATHRRLLPYWAIEKSFRPTGLTEHPLMLGLFCAVATSFVPLTRWRLATKVSVTFILVLGAFAAGARWASIGAALSVGIVLAIADWPSMSSTRRFQTKLILLIGAIVVLPLLVIALIQLGMVTRLQEGLFDESAMARVNIYGIFSLVSWSEILYGTDIDRIRTLALEYFGLEFIESSLIMFTFQFGLIGTVVFLAVLARTFVVLLSGASRFVRIGVVVFFVIASSNNSLSSKTPIVLMIILLVVGFHSRTDDQIAQESVAGIQPERA
jgi:hypothetical protein